MDATGTVTTDPAAVEGYIYWITFRKWRGQSVTLPNIQKTDVVAGNVPADVTIERVTEHTPPNSGSFKLSVGGQFLEVSGSTDLAYNVDTWRIASALQNLYGAS